MLRTKIVAVLLAICVFLCVLVFSAAAEDETCEISVSIAGSGFVTINGTNYYNDVHSKPFSLGETITMSATADEDFEFLFWFNRETRRIVSWEETYSFSVATYAMYEAVFDTTESCAAEEDSHTVIYLSEGGNIIYMGYEPCDDVTYFEDVGNFGMFVSGKSWIGWDQEPDVVAATPGRVFVRPIYSTDAKFSVTTIVAGQTHTYREDYLTTLSLNAPVRLNNGKEFTYWIAHAKGVNSSDEIASFYAQYSHVVTGDVTLEAVYGAEYDFGVTTRIAGDFPSFQESTISIFAEHCVTPDYQVTQHGMLITKDLQIGSFEDLFVINPAETRIIKRTANGTGLTGSFRANIGNWTAESAGSYTYYPRIFARAYVIVKDANGVSQTVYSPIYCVDYVFDTGSSGGDNNDDPFGN